MPTDGKPKAYNQTRTACMVTLTLSERKDTRDYKNQLFSNLRFAAQAVCDISLESPFLCLLYPLKGKKKQEGFEGKKEKSWFLCASLFF